MIVVVSSANDTHTQEVLGRLRRRQAEAYLLDLSTYPAESMLTITFRSDREGAAEHLTTGDGGLDFSDCRVLWWRRPQPLSVDQAIVDPDHQAFAFTEAYSAISGLWLTLDCFWINHPTQDEEAARKVRQLDMAQKVGLRIPDTCITNDPDRAREFIDVRGPERTVYKAFSGTDRAWRETRLVRPDEMDLLDNVRYAPVIFQEYVAAATDLRITVVEDAIFPAAIYSQETEYKVDFRMAMDSARIEPVELPRDITASLRTFMVGLGLVYGAIDMRLTPDGQYVFLEVNPSGQWLFIEQRTGQPITDAMADLMIVHDRLGCETKAAVPGD
jgi:glutathione synthase/RimK-type ligase-like ATP-grasp enzyme